MAAVARELWNSVTTHPKKLIAGIERVLIDVDPKQEKLKQDLVEIVEERAKVDVGISHLDSQHDYYDAIVLSNILNYKNIVENNEKICELLKKMLESLQPEGIAVIHENLEKFPINTIPNLTKLFDVFLTSSEHTNEALGFEFYTMKQVEASLYVGSNFLDVYWVLSKSRDLQLYDQKLVTFRDFLDKTQYTEDNVKAYEWIFGENFISPGGAPENLKILKKFKTLRPEIRMLDIGVGIGGGARQVAREFGVHVLGCDLSSNMLVHALERNQRDKDHRQRLCSAYFGSEEAVSYYL
uniref:phosphoethanolamine N-methyltransferase n=1 Tax=Acrobeloides nanus TaxID=290746 RepID=A0A914CVY9_9BILA